MGFDEMFREESRFQTKNRGAGGGGRGGDKRSNNKCHFGGKKIKEQEIGESSLTAAIREKMAG